MTTHNGQLTTHNSQNAAHSQRSVWAAFGVLAFVGGLVAVQAVPAAVLTRVYVVVADEKGQPVRGLAAGEFFLQVDGKPIEIRSVTAATEPAAVTILTDRLSQGGDYRPPELRKALRTFIEGVRGGHMGTTYALTTFDQIVTQVTRFPAGAALVLRDIDRLVGSSLDAPLVDALADACGTAGRAPTDRRIIFLVFASYRPDRGNPRIDITSERCRASGASLWAIEARSTDGRNYPNPAREQIILDTTRMSGGMWQYVQSASALDSLSRVMADLVSSQYAIVFDAGFFSGKSRVTIGVKRPGLFVMAPTWRPDS